MRKVSSTYDTSSPREFLKLLTAVARPRKSRASRPRVVAFTPRSGNQLAKHMRLQAEERLLMGKTWPRSFDDLVFRTGAGTPLDGQNVNRTLRVWLATAGIQKEPTVYGLRHTVASLAADAGTNVVHLADALGNDPRTLERYTASRRVRSSQ